VKISYDLIPNSDIFENVLHAKREGSHPHGEVTAAGLYSLASGRQPSRGSIKATLPCIERNRRAWGSLMNSVDDSFEYRKAPSVGIRCA
jgi:hypothetical protein